MRGTKSAGTATSWSLTVVSKYAEQTEDFCPLWSLGAIVEGMKMTDDSALLDRYVVDHSEAAFGEIVERHIGVVYHAALRQLHGDADQA